MLRTLPLFGLPLVDADRPTTITAMLNRTGRSTAAFVNAHCINSAARDATYTHALKTADFVLPDGSGISLAAKMTGRRLSANLNGTDLCRPLCAEAARRGISVFLLGAKPGVAYNAARTLVDAIPDLRIAGVQDGYFAKEETDLVIRQINESGAGILLVAMGVPLQDVWLSNHRHRLNPQLAMGVGALFDFEAGEVPRAPAPLRRMGMEWVWRLGVEPTRMARRYLLGNPAFLWRAMRHAVVNRRRTPKAMPLSKRMLDISIAGTALIGLLPLFALTGLAITLTSPGPVFFRQTRIGLHGKPFQMIKFRSMYIDAEARRAELLGQSEREGVCFKIRNDPRVTPVGRLIRRCSIDELPQIWNVLRGEMSIVGPRPALPEEVSAYPRSAMRRLNGVPGITGVWQVSGRAEVAFDRMVAMDVAYLRSKSLLLDLSLIARTARAVLVGRGAY